MKESNTASDSASDRATDQADINASNAEELYARISSDQALTQSLFRQALQDPTGSLERIVELGQAFDLPVTVQEVRSYLATLDDIDSKQWLVQARGGL